MQFELPGQKKRKHNRNPNYYSPPFSLNVKTNIGAAFLKLIDKHFHDVHQLHKFFKHSKIKVSYCTMPNMMKHINKHNAKILKEAVDNIDTRSCNCGQICPLNCQCLIKSVVYQADVECQNTASTYYGLTESTYKERYNKHKSSFRNPEQLHSMSLSKCESEGLEKNHFLVNKSTCTPYVYKRKSMCLMEKVTTLMADPKVTLDKWDEIMSKCRHKRKYLLGSIKPPEPINEHEPPDPT